MRSSKQSLPDIPQSEPHYEAPSSRYPSAPSGTPSLALRIECDGKVLAYTGDTEWIDTLIKAGQKADVLIAECYTYERKVRFHLDYATLRVKIPLIGARRV